VLSALVGICGKWTNYQDSTDISWDLCFNILWLVLDLVLPQVQVVVWLEEGGSLVLALGPWFSLYWKGKPFHAIWHTSR
jgi:hypothetical protein